MSVLLIDDDDDALSLLQMLLRRMGCVTQTAHTLGEARAVLAGGAIEVIVTDLELADGEDGLMLHPETIDRVARFIVLTGRTDVAAPVGVVVLQKPVDVTLLLAAMGHQT